MAISATHTREYFILMDKRLSDLFDELITFGKKKGRDYSLHRSVMCDFFMYHTKTKGIKRTGKWRKIIRSIRYTTGCPGYLMKVTRRFRYEDYRDTDYVGGPPYTIGVTEMEIFLKSGPIKLSLTWSTETWYDPLTHPVPKDLSISEMRWS